MIETASLEAIQNVSERFKHEDDHRDKQPKRRFTSSSNGRLNMSAYLDHYGINYKVKDKDRFTLYCLDHCLFDESHTQKEASIIQTADGMLLYQCFHDSCREKIWKEARQIISGEDKLTDFMERDSNQSGKKDDKEECLVRAKETLADLAERTKTDKGAPFEPEALSALKTLKDGAPSEFARLRDELKKTDISMRDLNKEIGKEYFRDHSNDALIEQAEVYEVVDGVICHNVRNQYATVAIPLCNFDVRIVGEEIHDDGAERKMIFAVEGKLHDGTFLPRSEVPAQQYQSMNWITSNWGTLAVAYAGFGTKDHLRTAIQLLSGHVPRHTVYSHIGWRKLDGKWVYLHGAGAIGTDGQDVQVNVSPGDSKMSHYVLPDPPQKNPLQDSVLASLSLLNVAPQKITCPLLSAVYRAPLGEAALIDLDLFISGPTGCKKTEVTALLQAHCGQGFHSRNLPGNWSSTANTLEKQAFLLKDALFVVDDFAPSGTASDVQRLHSKADSLLRAQGNRAGRGRMRPDGSLRPEYYPRGLILSSGEDIPRGQSLRARMLILELAPGEVDLEILTQLQEVLSTGLYAQAMSGYIQWLAPQMEGLKKTLPKRHRELRTVARLGDVNHDRTPDLVASLFLGLEMFLQFAREIDAITAQVAENLWQQSWQALNEAGRSQAAYHASEEPTSRFLLLLSAAITSGHAHLANAGTSEEPDNADNWGWRERTIGAGRYQRKEWHPLGDRTGWIDGEDLLLDPDAAYAVVQKLARDQGATLSIMQRTLWKRMAEKGLLASSEPSRNRNTVRRQLAGKRREVIHILASVLSPTKGPNVPDPINDAGLRSESLVPLFESTEKTYQKNVPETHSGQGAGPIGPFGTKIVDRRASQREKDDQSEAPSQVII